MSISSLTFDQGEASPARKERRTSVVTLFALVALVGLVAVGILGILFTQILAEGRRTDEYRDRLDRSLEIRSVTRRLFSALQAAETGERGFLLTGDPEFLEPYDSAVRELPSLIDQLLRLTIATPRHSNALRLRELSKGELGVLSLAIETRQHVSPEKAVEIVKDKRGKRQMDQIRAVVEEMIRTENRDITTYSAAVRERTDGFETMMLALVLALSGLLAGAAVLAVRYMMLRRRSEREWREAKQLAEQANRAKTDFLASMSHEIRTPLNGIIGYTELLFDGELTPEQRRYLERIHFAGSALLTIVNDVLDFSKVEAGRIDLDAQPFSLEALIDNAVSVVRSVAEQKGLVIQPLVAPEIPRTLIGDEARLRQILLNLLNNAVKFTLEGRVTLEVRCRSATDCATIRFAIADTGIGIPHAQRAHLFQRFSQLDSSIVREFGGTGLGLAISKRLVDLMGGEIGFESEEGRGSTFWFEVALPHAPDEVANPQGVSTVSPSGISGRILLVEDLEHNRDLARTILTAAGHEVHVAENGAEAVAAVQAHLYDIVLMDIQMPVMDGVTATRRIRELKHPASSIPIIAMSANVLPQQVRSFREAGMNDHVGKPFKRAELFQRLNTWLERAKFRQPPAEGQDPNLAELCELMGRDWVASGLHKLTEQIDEAFGKEPVGTAAIQVLAREAHALVSHAALLGFADFSNLCSELEEACANGRDVAARFSQAREAAQKTRRQAREMLQPMQA